MTLAMPDSTNVDDLPDGYPAYLGYADGAIFPATCGQLAARFPAAFRVCLTTTGATLADGCDVETGDLTIQGAAYWTVLKLKAAPASRPIEYASVSRMAALIAELGHNGIRRDQVRLLSAHYDNTTGPAAHICGPDTCKWPGVPPMDGTQWTSVFPGANGSRIDMSMLEDSFFELTWTERLVQQLPTVKNGDTGPDVKRVQGLLTADGYDLVTGANGNGIDGKFGPVTEAAVRAAQGTAGVGVDGIVGPRTWPVLLGVA